MNRTISTTILAVAAFVLIFCIAFTVIQSTCSDFGFFEREFIKLGLDSSMNMTVGDISKGLQALVDYMNGKVDSIDVDVMINGVLTPMYALDIEHIHMEEVREVWQGFETARTLGFLAAALLALLAVMTDNQNTLRNAAVGYLWALGAALVLCLFAGVWVATSFNSFWTQFHRLIFPNSENWLLPASSRMIQMLPGDLFQDLVIRCGLVIILILVILGAGAVAALVIPKKKMAAKVQAKAAPEEKKTETQTLVQEGPDLVLMHKLLNMSVTRRRKAVEELTLQKLQAEAEAKKQAEQNGEDSIREENARVKIAFAAYEGEEPAPEADEEEQEEAEWFRSLAERAKKKGKPASKKSSSKKKKKKKKAPEKQDKAPLLEETQAQAKAADEAEEAQAEEADISVEALFEGAQVENMPGGSMEKGEEESGSVKADKPPVEHLLEAEEPFLPEETWEEETSKEDTAPDAKENEEADSHGI